MEKAEEVLNQIKIVRKEMNEGFDTLPRKVDMLEERLMYLEDTFNNESSSLKSIIEKIEHNEAAAEVLNKRLWEVEQDINKIKRLINFKESINDSLIE